MKKIISWILLLIWLLIIFYLSNQNSDISGNSSGKILKNILNFIYDLFNINTNSIDSVLEIIHNPVRELMHTFEYLILGLLIFNLLRVYNVDNNIIIICILLSFCYSISDEIHQIFVKGRTFEYLDIIMDTLGSILGTLIGCKLMKRNL